MPTPNIGLTEPSLGTSPWDTIVNGNMTIIDNCLGGTQAVPAIKPTLLLGSSLVSPTNGNTVTLLNIQGPLAPVAGTGGNQVVYTYTLPANTVSVGKGLRITFQYSHSSGTANWIPAVQVNAVNVATVTDTGSPTTDGLLSAIVFADTATTAKTSEYIFKTVGGQALSHLSPTGLTWGSNQLVTGVVNVANTDQITPLLFVVELLQ